MRFWMALALVAALMLVSSRVDARTIPAKSAAAARPGRIADTYIKHSNANFNPCGASNQLLHTVSTASNCAYDWAQVGSTRTEMFTQLSPAQTLPTWKYLEANTSLVSRVTSAVADSSQPAASPVPTGQNSQPAASPAPAGQAANQGPASGMCFNYNTGRMIQCSSSPYATGPPQPRLQNPFFNPCGGWRQMLVSYAGATNCVMPPGDISVGGLYGATWIPASTQLVFNGTTLSSSTAATTGNYPGGYIKTGLPGRFELGFLPPQTQTIWGYNGNVNKGGATNMKFVIKNLFAFYNDWPWKNAQFIDAWFVTYIPPTGSEAWRGIGPSYAVNTSTTVAATLSPSGKGRILVNLTTPFTNSVISSAPGSCTTCTGHVTRGWGGALIGTMIWIHHSWRLNTSLVWATPANKWALNINPNYLISRRLVIGANYGGSGIIADQDQSINAVPLSTHFTTNPRFLNLGIYYMLGPTYEPFTNLPKTGAPGD